MLSLGIYGQSPVITGGSITDSGGYRYHGFTTVGTTVAEVLWPGNLAQPVELLVVARGGNGGSGVSGVSDEGGGGGGGGLVDTTIRPAIGSYNMVVGSNSTAFGFTALRGGDGGSGGNGGSGGSGGGGTGGITSNRTGGAATQPTSPSGGYGNAGQNGGPGVAGKGGGAGSTPNGREWPAGSGIYYAGGGGGGANVTPGLGGGGAGGTYSSSPQPGAANTGGGGGGVQEQFGTGAAGGSGVIRFRYLR